MQFFNSTDVAKKFGAISQIVRSEPVCVQSHGRPQMAMLSPAEYERLRHQDRGSIRPTGCRRACVQPSPQRDPRPRRPATTTKPPDAWPTSRSRSLGLVIRYAYLWKCEADRDQIEGQKHRPCVVVLCVEEVDGEKVVTVAPITHSSPDQRDQAIAQTPAKRRRLGLDLDEEKNWIMATEVNSFYFDNSARIR